MCEETLFTRPEVVLYQQSYLLPPVRDTSEQTRSCGMSASLLNRIKASSWSFGQPVRETWTQNYSRMIYVSMNDPKMFIDEIKTNSQWSVWSKYGSKCTKMLDFSSEPILITIKIPTCENGYVLLFRTLYLKYLKLNFIKKVWQTYPNN